MLFFLGKRHDNKILKVQILLSRNFVVMVQAPKMRFFFGGGGVNFRSPAALNKAAATPLNKDKAVRDPGMELFMCAVVL